MAEPRDKNGLTESEFLQSYNAGKYERPSVTADILALGVKEDFSCLKILLIKRGGHPYIGKWALPGGFIRKTETAYQAAARELEEETGLKDVYLEQIYTFTKPERDPRTWVMSIAYMALVSELKHVNGSDDADSAAWFDLIISPEKISLQNKDFGVNISYAIETKKFQNGAIKYENWVATPQTQELLAFDHIEIIIESFLNLKAKFEHSDLAFNLIGSKFTLPDLQVLYELILGKKLYKTNFRTMIAPKIKATGEKRKSASSNKMSAEYEYIDA